MKRCMCANTHTLTSDAHTFVIYCLFRIPHTASSPRFPACCLPVHAFHLWPFAYSLIPVACGLLHTRPPSAPSPQPPAPSPQPPGPSPQPPPTPHPFTAHHPATRKQILIPGVPMNGTSQTKKKHESGYRESMQKTTYIQIRVFYESGYKRIFAYKRLYPDSGFLAKINSKLRENKFQTT